jgi:hypothetical protein
MKAKTQQPINDADVGMFYRRVIQVLNRTSMPFLLGGGFALHFYTHIDRGIKDMDLFIRRADLDKVLNVLRQAGFGAELTFPHWLGKVFSKGNVVDIIFSSGNGLCEVDDLWFQRSTQSTLFDLPVRFCPPEETIWSKAFVMERERYDGSDIAHLILSCSERLDWHHLLFRFGSHWRVLLSHLVLFGYIYPSEKLRIPPDILRILSERLESETIAPIAASERLCYGTFLTRIQYRVDVEEMGYRDARLAPEATMSREEIAQWTGAADTEHK